MKGVQTPIPWAFQEAAHLERLLRGEGLEAYVGKDEPQEGFQPVTGITVVVAYPGHGCPYNESF